VPRNLLTGWRNVDSKEAKAMAVNVVEVNAIGVAEAATMLSLSVGAIRYRIRKGMYQAHKVMTATGETYLIDRADFLRVHPDCAERINVVDGMVQRPMASHGAVVDEAPPLDADGRGGVVAVGHDDQRMAFMALIGQGMREAVQPLAVQIESAHALAHAQTERAVKAETELMVLRQQSAQGRSLSLPQFLRPMRRLARAFIA